MDHSHLHHHEQHEREQKVGHQHPTSTKVSHDPAMHDKHAGHHTHDFLKRFWICLAVTIPVLVLSHMIQQWLGFELMFKGDKYVLLILSTFIYVYGGVPFLKGMVSEVKANAIGMMTLVAVAISVAFIY